MRLRPNVWRDLVATAKGLGGGMPVAGVTGRAEIMDAPEPGALGGTYGGNPIAEAAALAVLRVMEEERLADRAARHGDLLAERLEELRRKVPEVGAASQPGRTAIIGAPITRAAPPGRS